MFIEVVTLLRFEILTAKMLRHFSSVQPPTGQEEHGWNNGMVEGWILPGEKNVGLVCSRPVELGQFDSSWVGKAESPRSQGQKPRSRVNSG